MDHPCRSAAGKGRAASVLTSSFALLLVWAMVSINTAECKPTRYVLQPFKQVTVSNMYVEMRKGRKDKPYTLVCNGCTYVQTGDTLMLDDPTWRPGQFYQNALLRLPPNVLRRVSNTAANATAFVYGTTKYSDTVQSPVCANWFGTSSRPHTATVSGAASKLDVECIKGKVNLVSTGGCCFGVYGVRSSTTTIEISAPTYNYFVMYNGSKVGALNVALTGRNATLVLGTQNYNKPVAVKGTATGVGAAVQVYYCGKTIFSCDVRRPDGSSACQLVDYCAAGGRRRRQLLGSQAADGAEGLAEGAGGGGRQLLGGGGAYPWFLTAAPKPVVPASSGGADGDATAMMAAVPGGGLGGPGSGGSGMPAAAAAFMQGGCLSRDLVPNLLAL